MAKRRTRKQKEKAKHDFIAKLHSGPGKGSSEPVVKGQFKKSGTDKAAKTKPTKNADILAKQADIASVRREIIRSLILTSLILGTEIMVYLIWFR